MDAAIRVFKRVSGLPDNIWDAKVAGAAFCSIRLLVASTQAINLIGKQGSLIKSLQESTGASVRVLSGGMFWIFENIISIHTSSLRFLLAYIYAFRFHLIVHLRIGTRIGNLSFQPLMNLYIVTLMIPSYFFCYKFHVECTSLLPFHRAV